MSNQFAFGRPVNQLDFAVLLGQQSKIGLSSGPSGQVILPGNLPAGTTGQLQVLYWDGSMWLPTNFTAIMNAWLANLPTTLPGTSGQFWNNNGVISIS